jgi:hypothetical protein
MVAKLTTLSFAGFGTDRLRCEQAMKTAGRENPNHRAIVPRNRTHGAVGQSRSRSIKWVSEARKSPSGGAVSFLDFIELIGTWD